MEILIVSNAIANQIREGKTFQIESAMQVGGKDGMVLMNDALVNHVIDGVIDAQEALHRSLKRKDILDKFEVKGIDTSGLVVDEE